MKQLRRSGILLHPTSLPGPHGSGDFGPAARHFVDWLVSGGQSSWQMLPLGPTGPGNSPYMSPSAFAGNPLLIDLGQLVEAGWLDKSEIAGVAGLQRTHVDFAVVYEFRMDRLRRAATRFFAAADAPAESAAIGEPAGDLVSPASAVRADFADFCSANAAWLDDYALFVALEAAHGGPWQDWPAPLAGRDPAALAAAVAAHAEAIAFARFCQWCFQRQWSELKRFANSRGIEVIGDLPIFVAGHSADVWANPQLFELDATGRPQVVAGVPPDYFSKTGQRWGNPLYRWNAHAADGYRWWVARLRHALAAFDRVRIDHFRGFESYWEIPADAATAVDGRWRPGPGAALFTALRSDLGAAYADAAGVPRIIAEDLGIITRAVAALRESLGLPGMRILQFAFDGKSHNPYLPHSYEANTVAYTGTHDNDTTRGWWNGLSGNERDYVRRYLGSACETIPWDLIRAVSASVAALSVVPMQDVLGLDSEHRMNRPGQPDGAWGWRFTWDQVGPWHAGQLAELAHLHGRWPGDHGGEEDET